MAEDRSAVSKKRPERPAKSFKIHQNPSKSLAEVELLREHSILLMHP
jgi:hypothetical protein